MKTSPESPHIGGQAKQPGSLNLRGQAWRIAASYAGFAVLWIYFSDNALGLLFPDREMMLKVSVFKGLFFVTVTSLLLLLLMKRSFSAIERHVTEIRDNEIEIERINRLYSVLSQINQAIVRIPSQKELFEQSCEILVKNGGFAMASVSWHDAESQEFVPLAVAGDNFGQSRDILVRSDDQPEGRGPSGKAFRSGTASICNDLLNDPDTRPWRDAIRKRGLLSSASFPIRFQGNIEGMLGVYSEEVGYFQDREIALLEEAVVDISFALENAAREEEKKCAEARARSEKTFSDTMIESMPGIVYFYDSKGKFLRWNRNFEIITGYTGEEIANMHPLDFFQKSTTLHLTERIREVFEIGESTIEAPIHSRDGTCTPYFLTGRKVIFEGEACLVGIGIDISERIRAEQAVRELNASLEHRVIERTEELNSALVRAEAADRIKSAFLATMSHELRTPLNSIIGFTGILIQELAGPLNPEQAKQLGMVRSSARHLLALINDVLDISKIEAGQLDVHVDSFDLCASLEKVISLVKPMADAKNLQIDSHLPPAPLHIDSDLRRVEQILLNLLNNAVKFTEKGGISLHLDVIKNFSSDHDQLPMDAARIRIIDTGIGIREEDLKLLFQPFRQLDSGLTRQHEGTGLGLAICKRLVNLLGGNISAHSKIHQGSEFHLILPLKPRPAP